MRKSERCKSVLATRAAPSESDTVLPLASAPLSLFPRLFGGTVSSFGPPPGLFPRRVFGPARCFEGAAFRAFSDAIPKVQKSVLSCRPRKMLQNEYLVAKIDFDTAKNEPRQVVFLGRKLEVHTIVYHRIRHLRLGSRTGSTRERLTRTPS